MPLPIFAAALMTSLTINPLLFEAVQTRDGKRVLFIRDCGNLASDNSGQSKRVCNSWERQFSSAGWYPNGRDSAYYTGDLKALNDTLSRSRFSEVWIYSGGGHLNAGIGIGRIFRDYQLTVRVPDALRILTLLPGVRLYEGNISCVSSCTVAFMGGFFRYVDDSATFRVHSASSVSEEIDHSTLKTLSARGLRAIAEEESVQAASMGVQLATLFLNTFLRNAGQPLRSESRDQLFAQVRAIAPNTSWYSDADETRDKTKYQREGPAALQEILMEMERKAMNYTVTVLRRSWSGKRAENALDMVDRMYSSSIVGSFYVDRAALLQFAYVTRDISPNHEF